MQMLFQFSLVILMHRRSCVCHALSALRRSGLLHAIFTCTVKTNQWQQTPCCLNGGLFYTDLQQSAIINEKLECKNRMGEIKRRKRKCESSQQLTDASLHKLCRFLFVFVFFWKRHCDRRCTSLILTSLGEIVPAPEPVSGPVPCRF